MINEAEVDAHVEKHMGLAPYQQRVVEEKQELDGRLMRLTQFFDKPEFIALPTEDRLLLIAQHTHMHALSNTLGTRIARFISTSPEIKRS